LRRAVVSRSSILAGEFRSDPRVVFADRRHRSESANPTIDQHGRRDEAGRRAG